MAWTYSLTYTQVNDYSAKDALSSGDSEKIILGADVDAELSGIATALNSKLDSGSVSSQAEAEAGTDTESVMTPQGVQYWGDANDGIVGDLRAISGLGTGGDKLFFFDDTDDTSKALTLGNGLDINTTTLRVDPTIAGDGCTYTSGVIDVVGTAGITANADNIALTDVTAGAAQPVVITSGTFTFDLSSITTMSIEDLNVAQDGVVMSDNGTIKVLPADEAGVDVVEVSNANQTFALTDANTYQLLTSIATADKTWTVPTNASVAFKIGTTIMFGDRDGDGTYNLLIVGDTGVTLTSYARSASGASGQHTCLDGGTGMIIKVATDEWMVMGDVI
jgi:hypothetical protein